MCSTLTEFRSEVTRKGFAALNRVAVPAVKAGFGAPLPIGVGLVVLETTGRTSGHPRRVPLVAARVGRHVRVSTVRGDSQWVKNLEAQPDAAVWVGGHRRAVTSTVDSGPLTVANLILS